MIARLGEVLQRWASKAIPDPFVLAIGLTALVAALGAARLYLTGGAGPDGIAWTLVDGWLGDFTSSGLLAFALMMALILVTGHALALSPAVQRFVNVVAQLPKGPGSAAALVAAVACGAAVLHWGLGAIVGALLAREIGRNAAARGVRLHYPLLGAAAYSGFAVWHGGLSGSAPVTVAAPDHFLAAKLAGVFEGGVVPVTATLWGPLNLVVTGGLMVLIPLACFMLTPRDPADWQAPRPDQLAPLPDLDAGESETTIDRFQRNPWLGRVVGALGTGVLLWGFGAGRLTFNLHTVVLLFLFVGILLQGSLVAYARAVADGARGAGAIVLQFPFYFGILGLMKASGLIGAISGALVAASNATTFPVLAFLSAGVVNFFVPSGGGQWAVQGEILLTAGAAHGVNPVTTIMAFSYGDAWTNLLQPFWALPLLGIMGLRARDIIGYTAVVLLMMAVVVPTALLALG